MPNMWAILTQEQGREKVIIPGSEMYKILFGKGARALDLTKTPAGHLALKVGECGAAAEDKGSMSFTSAANPQCEDDPLLVRGVSDPEPAAGAPAVGDAHAYTMSQDTKGISFSINEETFAFTFLSLVNNTLKTWRRRNASFGANPTSADQDFALRNL
eukprot:91305-Pyramimonas_sp.AAC.1